MTKTKVAFTARIDKAMVEQLKQCSIETGLSIGFILEYCIATGTVSIFKQSLEKLAVLHHLSGHAPKGKK